MSVTANYCPADCPCLDIPYCRENTAPGMRLVSLKRLNYPDACEGLRFLRRSDCPLAQPELSNSPTDDAPRMDTQTTQS